MPKPRLTPPQRARLEKLAAYLESLPASYQHFDMADYFGLDENDPRTIDYAKRNGGVAACGTVACAVGHGPAAGILVPPRFIYDEDTDNPVVDWVGYADMFTGGGANSNRVWVWCFGPGWAHCDNHHHGAAARIRYMLDKGLPDEWGASHEARSLYAPYRIDAKAPAA